MFPTSPFGDQNAHPFSGLSTIYLIGSSWLHTKSSVGDNKHYTQH
jgi:hypothetical protein